MTVRTKVIGRQPTDHGPYDPNLAYGEKFQCTLFGCSWESKHDNNTTAPAVWDGGDTITPNLVDWKKVSGSYEAWLMNKDKPATTGTTGDYPYNGMGRVKLAKNMVNTGTDLEPVMVNTLTQDMFYKGAVGSRVPNTNTIFVIQYDYELAEDITIPSGCVLEFAGGSISGAYILTGNKTKILGTNVYINPEVSFAGTFVINTVYVDWFINNRADGVYIDNALTKAIQLAKLALTSLTFGGNVDQNICYKCIVGGFDVSGLTIYGNGSLIFALDNVTSLFVSRSSVCIKDLKMSAYPYPSASAPTSKVAISISEYNGFGIVIDNCEFDGFYRGISVDRVWNLNITNNDFLRCVFGIYSEGLSVNNRIVNNTIRVNTDVTDSRCIYINGLTEGWIISNNTLLGGDYGIMLNNCANVIISNNIMDLQQLVCIKTISNCAGLFITGNYFGLNEGGNSIISCERQSYQNNEDTALFIENNNFKGYGDGPIVGFINLNSYNSKCWIIRGNTFKTTNRLNDRILPIGSQDNIFEITCLIFKDNFYDVYTPGGADEPWPFASWSNFTKTAISDNMFV